MNSQSLPAFYTPLPFPSISTINTNLSFVTSSQNLIMDYQSLVHITQLASLQVLNYHLVMAEDGCGLPALDQKTKRKISEKIKRFLPLTNKSVKKPEACVEVICDAAMTVAENYNINKRAFYAAVQNLATMTLLPSVYEEAGDPLPLSAYHLRLHGKSTDEEDREEEDVQPTASPQKSSAAPNNRVFWKDAEIREVIDRKMAGESFQDIAARFGRSTAAIQNKLRNAGKTGSDWREYIDKKRSETLGGLDGEDEQSEESESSEDDEADEEVQLPALVADAGAAKDNPADVEQLRPWTESDKMELIRYKISGMGVQAITKQMNRPCRSIHCQWLNMSTNPNSWWFSYIHKQYRAKRKQQSQEKASRGGNEANADLAGQSDPVSLSLFTYIFSRWFYV